MVVVRRPRRPPRRPLHPHFVRESTGKVDPLAGDQRVSHRGPRQGHGPRTPPTQACSGRTAARFSGSPRRSPNAWRASRAHLLFILDEAFGHPARDLRGGRGNRRRRQDPAAVRTHGPRASSTTPHEQAGVPTGRCISAPEETPNVTGEGPAIPGLASRAWVDEKRREWGEDSPLYQVRVRGNFPAHAANAIVGLALVVAGSSCGSTTRMKA